MRRMLLIGCLIPAAASAGWVELDHLPEHHPLPDRTLVDSWVVGAGHFDRSFSPAEDVAIAVEWTGGATVLHTVGLAGGQLHLSDIAGDFPYSPSDPTTVQDVDGDGADDLVVLDRGRRAVHLSRRDGFRYAPRERATGPHCDMALVAVHAGARCVAIGDVDGDGRDEVLLERDIGGERVWTVHTRRSQEVWTTTRSPDVEVIGLADADGDGRDDLWLQYDHGGERRWQVRLSTGRGFSIDRMPATSTRTSNVRAVGLADADGDGLADLWLEYDLRGTRRWQVRRSTGSGFLYNGDWTTTRTRNVEVLDIADADGDGRADLWLTWDTPSGDLVRRRFQLRPSTGTAFGTPIGGAEIQLGREAVLVRGGWSPGHS